MNLKKNDCSFIYFKICLIVFLFLGIFFLPFLTISQFNLTAECPFIPESIITVVSAASDAAGAIGLVAAIAASGGFAAIAAPIVIRYIRKYGLKFGIAM